MTLLDVSKAFDSVWHNDLIYKMIIYKFPKYLIHIIYFYIRLRKLYVNYNDIDSENKSIVAGIPQGSILGP